jgi:hypothetical protein
MMFKNKTLLISGRRGEYREVHIPQAIVKDAWSEVTEFNIEYDDRSKKIILHPVF